MNGVLLVDMAWSRRGMGSKVSEGVNPSERSGVERDKRETRTGLGYGRVARIGMQWTELAEKDAEQCDQQRSDTLAQSILPSQSEMRGEKTGTADRARSTSASAPLPAQSIRGLSNRLSRSLNPGRAQVEQQIAWGFEQAESADGSQQAFSHVGVVPASALALDTSALKPAHCQGTIKIISSSLR